MNRRGAQRLAKYMGISISTFAFDLLLLALFIDLLNVQYVLAAALSFFIAVSINYPLSRAFVFPGTLRSIHAGYAMFLSIAASGIVLVSILMFLIVELTHIDPIHARIIVAGVVGLWNYLMNLYVNFRVAGVHSQAGDGEVHKDRKVA